MIPGSFCTICNKFYKEELLCFLLTLSFHHENEIIYILCDKEVKTFLNEITPKPKLKIKIYSTLNRFSLMKKTDMLKMGIWNDFQLMKMDIMKHAIENVGDTLYLDCDNVILSRLDGIDKNKQLGVSKSYTKKKIKDERGKYSGGMLWCNNINIIDDWKKLTYNSRYYDQAAIETLVERYNNFDFGENYDFQKNTFSNDRYTEKEIASKLISLNDKIYYNKLELKNIHIRFTKKLDSIDNYILLKLRESRFYKEILCIFRCINKKWLIYIPKQPTDDEMFKHKNDRFRQLAFLMKLNNNDVEIEYTNQTYHCWLHPDVLLYDRPSLDWCNSEVAGSSVILLGNCNVSIEGKELKDVGLNVKKWLFWPQYPMVVEKNINDFKEVERNIDILFIGDRDLLPKSSNKRWNNIISEYMDCIDCQGGIDYMKRSKFGLCVKPFKGKSNMMMELMAFGTIPIISVNVMVDDFDDLKENVHYIRVASPKQLKRKLENISDEKRREMSNACKDWYMNNIHSSSSWKRTINNILYS